MSGPSPRARGAGPLALHLRRQLGTIPAGAGSRCGTTASTRQARDHPRGRGEQIRSIVLYTIGAGPSPRARGAGRPRPLSGRAGGTIPAGAGSRGVRGTEGSVAGDHPRGRGEQPAGAQASGPSRGPSPRARGAEGRDVRAVPGRGTIPAGAGSSGGGSSRSGDGRDHPRGRGEQTHAELPCQADQGPSPRARGAVVHRPPAHQDVLGTIPAGAGSRASRSASRASMRDHPRGRGEQTLEGVSVPGTGGPSPRARGAEGKRRGRRAEPGTIPAGAGSSWSGPGLPRGTRDHPRGRGEQR